MHRTSGKVTTYDEGHVRWTLQGWLPVSSKDTTTREDGVIRRHLDEDVKVGPS